MARRPACSVSLTAWASGSHHVLVRDRIPAVLRHVHRRVCVTAVRDARLVYGFSSEDVALEAGSLLVIASGVPHCCHAAGGGGGMHASLCVARERLSLSHPVTIVSSPPLADGLFDLCAASEDRFLAQLQAQLHHGSEPVAISGRTGQEEQRTGPPHDVLTMLRVMEERRTAAAMQPGAGFSLDLLADACGGDAVRLARRFRAYMGLPPYAWHMVSCIQQGADMLARGVPIAEVALRCGFFDQSHFAHRFRQIMGLTPGQYARAFAGVHPQR